MRHPLKLIVDREEDRKRGRQLSPQQIAAERPLPILFEFLDCGLHCRRIQELLRDIHRQRDGLAARQQALQRLARRFEAGGQHLRRRRVQAQQLLQLVHHFDTVAPCASTRLT